ncbi:hypothetical protein VXM60_06660 [Shewanella khirikhana]|uniref:hypothetical protein n=1 Tax=Shewanella khirikhana TaxID=1965282 RepID=UPI0030D57C3D
MLFGMSWWASIFVLAALVIIAYEIKAQTSHEGLEEETTTDLLLFVGRQLYFVALMLLAVLSYQDSSHPLVYWPLVIAALCTLPVGIGFTLEQVIQFVKNPKGKDEDDGEETGLLFNTLGHLIPISFYVVGIKLALSATEPLWRPYVPA